MTQADESSLPDALLDTLTEWQYKQTPLRVLCGYQDWHPCTLKRRGFLARSPHEEDKLLLTFALPDKQDFTCEVLGVFQVFPGVLVLRDSVPYACRGMGLFRDVEIVVECIEKGC